MYEKVSIDPARYVVLDVETNGLRSKKDDLLSLSLYKPDDGKEYNRFFPLELSEKVKRTGINGIVKDDLIDAKPLSQEEFDELVEGFELKNRTILIYSGNNFDERFFREYLIRHKIRGFEQLNFYDFKRHIISSEYSNGIISKDNLCMMFGIDNVQKIHTGKNDCRLEWELFVKLGGDYYIAKSYEKYDKFYRLTPEYIIPVSYLVYYPNLKKLLKHRPCVECLSDIIKTFTISGEGIERFGTNADGLLVEHLINSMLRVKKEESFKFLLENKRKLEYVGKVKNNVRSVLMVFKEDGTVAAVKKEDAPLERSMNKSNEKLKERLQPLVDYIREEIFCGASIKSQELVIDEGNNILAVCDLSTDVCIMEIKTNGNDPYVYREQLFYEANGRMCCYLCMDWNIDDKRNVVENICFKIYKVKLGVKDKVSADWTEGKRAENRAGTINEIEKALYNTKFELVKYTNLSSPVQIRCSDCKTDSFVSYSGLMNKIPVCKVCYPDVVQKAERVYSPVTVSSKGNLVRNEYQKKRREAEYSEKIKRLSEGKLVVSNYDSPRRDVDIRCIVCGYEWRRRADHLTKKCICPNCNLQGYK